MLGGLDVRADERSCGTRWRIVLAVKQSHPRPRSALPDDHRTVERRSLAYHRVIASRLSEGDVDRARARLDEWEARGDVDSCWIGRYRRMLSQPLAQLKQTLVADTEGARELRHAGLFTGVLSEGEREQILRTVH